MENCKEKIEHLQKDLRVLKNQCDRKFEYERKIMLVYLIY